ncbi:MAG TPA: NAD(P)-binding domain-containing protein [Terriglobales bacterium]|jgi:predicted dinucleotide-binding enzyme|nr:NAD(P)-binding domain-containing protein [Terriglobales bacterium]
MKVGFIGAGSVTGTFGRHLINAGHTIVVSNSRGPATLAGFVADLGPGAIAGTREQAIECDVVILAVHWVKVREALKGIDWRGRILIDATNAHMDPKPVISLAGVTRSRAALKGRTSSEIVAEMVVGARLVKSISNMPMAWIQDFSPNKPRTVIFTSGDDIEAKQLVIELINSIGLVAIDLGSLVTGGAMHEVGAPLSGIEFHFVRRLR